MNIKQKHMQRVSRDEINESQLTSYCSVCALRDNREQAADISVQEIMKCIRDSV